MQDITTLGISWTMFSKRLWSPGSFPPPSDFAFIKDVDAVAICVPTPLDKYQQPDISYVKGSTESVAKYLHPGMVVVLESTTYPGTTEELLKPILESHRSEMRRRTSIWPSRRSASIRAISSIRRRIRRRSSAAWAPDSTEVAATVVPQCPGGRRLRGFFPGGGGDGEDSWRIPTAISTSAWPMRWPSSATAWASMSGK